MINKQIKLKQVTILLLILLLLFTMLFCILFTTKQFNLYKASRGPSGLGSYPERGKYRINPETILASLEQGDIDIFVPISATSELGYPLFSPGSFPWKQSDYLKIANAVHQSVWQENLDGWRIYSMFYFIECQDYPIGFDGGEITFFRPTPNGPSYDIRTVIINPLSGEVEWGGASYPRTMFGWKSINLSELKITADIAFDVAEENGGRETRLEIENACRILLIFKPNGDNDGWSVIYSDGSQFYFNIEINPYTGQYRVIPIE